MLASAFEQLHTLALGGAVLLVVFGGLTFVIYISQGFVIPAMDLLVGLGVGGTLALAAPMGVFLAVVGFTSFKLYRSYF